MKRVFAVCMILAVLMTGCGAAESGASSSTPAASAPQSQVESVGENTLTGTLDEVKDTMIVVTDENGESFALSFTGEKPAGLDEVAVGDTVTVTYTGELSVVDAFTGTIISVEAAK